MKWEAFYAPQAGEGNEILPNHSCTSIDPIRGHYRRRLGISAGEVGPCLLPPCRVSTSPCGNEPVTSGNGPLRPLWSQEVLCRLKMPHSVQMLSTAGIITHCVCVRCVVTLPSMTAA